MEITEYLEIRTTDLVLESEYKKSLVALLKVNDYPDEIRDKVIKRIISIENRL